MKNTVITIIGGVIGGAIIFNNYFFYDIFSKYYGDRIFRVIHNYIIYPFPAIYNRWSDSGRFFIKNTTEILGYGVAGGILATMLVIIILIDRTDMPTGALSILYYFSYPTLIIIGGTMAGVIYGQKYKNK